MTSAQLQQHLNIIRLQIETSESNEIDGSKGPLRAHYHHFGVTRK